MSLVFAPCKLIQSGGGAITNGKIEQNLYMIPSKLSDTYKDIISEDLETSKNYDNISNEETEAANAVTSTPILKTLSNDNFLNILNLTPIREDQEVNSAECSGIRFYNKTYKTEDEITAVWQGGETTGLFNYPLSMLIHDYRFSIYDLETQKNYGNILCVEGGNLLLYGGLNRERLLRYFHPKYLYGSSLTVDTSMKTYVGSMYKSFNWNQISGSMVFSSTFVTGDQGVSILTNARSLSTENLKVSIDDTTYTFDNDLEVENKTDDTGTTLLGPVALEEAAKNIYEFRFNEDGTAVFPSSLTVEHLYSTYPLGRAYGGTGMRDSPLMTVNLESEEAVGIYLLTNPSPGVKGILPIKHGGTGLKASPSMIVNLGSESAAEILATSSPEPGIKGTLPITHGGTGLTASPSMIVNLGSTSSVGILTTSSPQPGVTGTLPVAHGGTGVGTLAAHCLMIGNSTSKITMLSPSTSGYILFSNGTSSDPSFKSTSNITTVGTITSGTWNGTVIDTDHGGTGRNSLYDESYESMNYRAIKFSTTDLTAGTSSLGSGQICLVYAP